MARPECGRRPVLLVSLPHAGGSVAGLPWRGHLPPALAGCMVPLELPGRGRRYGEAVPARLADLADDVAGQVRAATGDASLVLQGHSMGAILAYEVARRLLAGGIAIDGLILSGRVAPHWPHLRPMRHVLGDADLLEEVRRLGGTPEAVLADRDLMDLLLPMVRADFRLVETYVPQPGPPLPLPACIVGGREDDTAPLAGLEAWRQVICGPVQVELWPGGHFFPLEAPARYAGLIRRVMESAMEQGERAIPA